MLPVVMLPVVTVAVVIVAVEKAPVEAEAAPIGVPSIAPPLMSTKSSANRVLVPSQKTFATLPAGIVTPLPAAVLTRML
jgi:hypothetical protein